MGFVGSINIEAIFKTVKLNEWATLIISRMLVRKGLTTIAGTNQSLGLAPSLQDLLAICREKGVLPADLDRDLERLRNVTYFAEWWQGRVPTRDEWKWALDNCRRVVQALFDLQPVV